MATLAPIAVVGGPLRTGRTGAIDRVIRIQQSPHGALNGGALINADGQALGIITSLAIRGTTVVIPASLAWAAAAKAASEGGAKQGFLGVSSMPVALPERQRAGRSQASGLLISHVAANSPAESGGLLVGDVIVGFGGEAIEDAESLVTRLRGNKVGAAVPITVIRGAAAVDVTVTVSERPRTRGIVPLRVFLSGRASDELDALQKTAHGGSESRTRRSRRAGGSCRFAAVRLSLPRRSAEREGSR